MFTSTFIALSYLYSSGPAQVNNATARVVTKKPQTALVNGEISSKMRLLLFHAMSSFNTQPLTEALSLSFWLED